MRLFFQDGIVAGLDIPWFEDVKPGRVMDFSITDPPQKLFYKVTEDFNQGRRVLVQAKLEDLEKFQSDLCAEVISDLTKRRQSLRREIIWNSFGMTACFACMILNLITAYKGDWFAPLWQILHAALFVFAGCLIKIQVHKRRRLAYAIENISKISITTSLSRCTMLTDQVLAALDENRTVGIPTLFKKIL